MPFLRTRWNTKNAKKERIVDEAAVMCALCNNFNRHGHSPIPVVTKSRISFVLPHSPTNFDVTVERFARDSVITQSKRRNNTTNFPYTFFSFGLQLLNKKKMYLQSFLRLLSLTSNCLPNNANRCASIKEPDLHREERIFICDEKK